MLVNDNDAFGGVLFGVFFSILLEVFQVWVFQVTENWGPNSQFYC